MSVTAEMYRKLWMKEGRSHLNSVYTKLTECFMIPSPAEMNPCRVNACGPSTVSNQEDGRGGTDRQNYRAHHSV